MTRERLFIDVACTAVETIVDKAVEQVAMVLPTDGGVLGEPSGDATTVVYLQRYGDTTRITNSHSEITLWKGRLTTERETDAEERKANFEMCYIR